MLKIFGCWIFMLSCDLVQFKKVKFYHVWSCQTEFYTPLTQNYQYFEFKLVEVSIILILYVSLVVYYTVKIFLRKSRCDFFNLNLLSKRNALRNNCVLGPSAKHWHDLQCWYLQIFLVCYCYKDPGLICKHLKSIFSKCF